MCLRKDMSMKYGGYLFKVLKNRSLWHTHFLFCFADPTSGEGKVVGEMSVWVSSLGFHPYFSFSHPYLGESHLVTGETNYILQRRTVVLVQNCKSALFRKLLLLCKLQNIQQTSVADFNTIWQAVAAVSKLGKSEINNY